MFLVAVTAVSLSMTVNVVVTDMDGTFLDDAKQYDRVRFMAQYRELKT